MSQRIERLHGIINWFDVHLEGKKTKEHGLICRPNPKGLFPSKPRGTRISLSIQKAWAATHLLFPNVIR
jgi:hypothetical protein